MASFLLVKSFKILCFESQNGTTMPTISNLASQFQRDTIDLNGPKLSADKLKKGYSLAKELVAEIAIPVFVAHTWKIIPAPVAFGFSAATFLVSEIASRVFQIKENFKFSNFLKFGLTIAVGWTAIIAATPVVAGALGVTITGAALGTFLKTSFVAWLAFTFFTAVAEWAVKQDREKHADKIALHF